LRPILRVEAASDSIVLHPPPNDYCDCLFRRLLATASGPKLSLPCPAEASPPRDEMRGSLAVSTDPLIWPIGGRAGCFRPASRPKCRGTVLDGPVSRLTDPLSTGLAYLGGLIHPCRCCWLPAGDARALGARWVYSALLHPASQAVARNSAYTGGRLVWEVLFHTATPHVTTKTSALAEDKIPAVCEDVRMHEGTDAKTRRVGPRGPSMTAQRRSRGAVGRQGASDPASGMHQGHARAAMYNVASWMAA
jgi:hypothetical protein